MQGQPSGPTVAHPPLGAAPSATGYGAVQPWGAPSAPGLWVWAAGEYLCFRQGAQLPMVCPKTNEETRETATITFLWRPAWAYALLLLGLIPYLIVMAIYQRTARVVVPLSPDVIRKRRLGHALAVGGFLLFFVVLFGGALASHGKYMGLGVAGAFVALIGGLVGMAVLSRPFKVLRVTRETVVLGGVHPGYLARLPQAPLPDRD